MLSNCGAGEDSWESFNSKEIKPVNPKGNQPWILTGRTDAETEVPIFWPPDATANFIGKTLDAGKDWRQKEKRATEDEMVGWHHRFNRHELGQTPGDGGVQGGLACCSPWNCKELDVTWDWTTTKNCIQHLIVTKRVYTYTPTFESFCSTLEIMTIL